MSNKHNFGTQNIFNGGAKFDNIFIGKVVDTTDKFDGNRIKVRIKGVDDKISDSDLTYELQPQFQYDISKTMSARFGYRRLYYDIKNERSSMDVTFSGFIVGLGFIF